MANVNRLRENLPGFVEALRTCIEPVLDVLLARGALVEDDVHRVRAGKVPDDKARELLARLRGRGEESCEIFLRVMDGQEYASQTARSPQRQRHRECLKKRHKAVHEYGVSGQSGKMVCSHYVPTTIVASRKVTDRPSNEVLDNIERYQSLSNEDGSFTHVLENERIFLDVAGQAPRLVLVLGIAGVGKSTFLQKIICDWADEVAFLQFHTILHFTFKLLNQEELEREMSLHDLVVKHYSHLKDELEKMLKDEQEGLLVIFDGLDESKLDLNFESTPICTDVRRPQSLPHMLVNILRGSLLENATVMVTSRPAACGTIPEDKVQLFVEILGFSNEQRKEYFLKHCGEEEKAKNVQRYINMNKPLLLMCHIPAFCWIVTHSLKDMLPQGQSDPSNGPQTMTEIYSTFLKLIISYHGTEDTRSVRVLCRDLTKYREWILNLGKVSFLGMLSQSYEFTDEFLRANGVVLSNVPSMFLREFLKQENMSCRQVFHFTHLTLQEYLAALYFVVAVLPSCRLYFGEEYGPAARMAARGRAWVGRLFNRQRHLRRQFLCAVRASQEHSGKGRLDMFCRFAAGLLSERTQQLLPGLLGERSSPDAAAVAAKLEVMVTHGELPPEQSINVLYCLQELRITSIVEPVKLLLHGRGKVETLRPCDYTALAFLLQLELTTSSRQELPLWLEGCDLNHEGLRRLLPILPLYSKMWYDNNKLGEKGAEVIAEALRSEDCRIKALYITHNNVGAEGARHVAEALMVNTSLDDLRFACNKIGAEGARYIGEMLKVNTTLTNLRLRDNHMCDEGGRYIVEGLRLNRGMKEIWLYDNNFTKTTKDMLKVLKEEKADLEIYFEGS
ncbi:unnamed protein product [Lampetra planeri]